MRTLCLNLQRDDRSSVAENFLAFSPRVHYRAPGLVFVDISSSAGLFGGEQKLLDEALSVSRDFFPNTTAAIADSPWSAQLFCRERPSHISPPTQELKELDSFPLHRLHDLEGLIAWRSQTEVEHIVDFFYLLGINQLGGIKKFQADSFRERWQETGTLIWKRLHGLDKQIISPLVPAESLKDYVHMDFSVSLQSFLLHCLEKSLQRLMGRLQGRGEFARRIVIQLFCEYSGRCHLVELSPASPGRNLELFMKLLENKMSDISLENPIKHYEIEVIPTPEKTQQLDFFEPRSCRTDQDKLGQLVSVFQQSKLMSGFIKPKDELMPEESWELTSTFEEYEALQDDVEVEGRSLQIRPAYSHMVREAPRPSRLLKKPKRLGNREVEKMDFLSTQPIERLEHGWWDTSRGRDYFFAVSPKGQFLWIYLDRIENEYYLQGYFD
jgi:protein ImuB